MPYPTNLQRFLDNRQPPSPLLTAWFVGGDDEARSANSRQYTLVPLLVSTRGRYPPVIIGIQRRRPFPHTTPAVAGTRRYPAKFRTTTANIWRFTVHLMLLMSIRYQIARIHFQNFLRRRGNIHHRRSREIFSGSDVAVIKWTAAWHRRMIKPFRTR